MVVGVAETRVMLPLLIMAYYPSASVPKEIQGMYARLLTVHTIGPHTLVNKTASEIESLTGYILTIVSVSVMK